MKNLTKNFNICNRLSKMNKIKLYIIWILTAFCLNTYISAEINFPPPTPIPELKFTNSFFPGAKYNPDIPTIEKLIGFSSGEKAASPEQIYCCLTNWNKSAPDKTILFKYADSYEGRPLFYIVISSQKNIQRIEEIKEKIKRLANPERLSPLEAEKLISDLPAIVWLGYTIHGTETEGSDAALAVIYHLIASQDDSIRELLENLVIIIDPVMNPDGRHRFVKMIEENRGSIPDIDSQDLIHTGYWPQGRGNHYLFDLNRDWLYCLHPETQGRVREFNKWNPVFFMDAHGMGAFDTHLFSPPREPRNPYFPQSRHYWHNIFASNLAKAFDKYRLLYYTGEWHEEFFPGYADAYTSLRGSVGILHEQASISAYGIRRPEGRILTYKESVFHHVIATMANLQTAFSNRASLLKNFYQIRRESIESELNKKTYVVLYNENKSRMNDLIQLLLNHNIDIYRSISDYSAKIAIDQLGRELRDFKIPSGSLFIPKRQPLGCLVSALFEFDPKLSESALEAERKEILSKNRSRIYDTTAWNITMMYGIKAVTLNDEPRINKIKITAETIESYRLPATNKFNPEKIVAGIINGEDDASISAAARLLEVGLKVRIAEKDFQINDKHFSRGSVVITVLDNRQKGESLFEEIQKALNGIGAEINYVDTGYAEGDLPDLGGRHFKLLEYPRIAIFGHKGFKAQDYGSIWFTIEKYLGIRHTKLDDYESPDLFRYNVLILPDGAPNFSSNRIAVLKDWVKSGGTLIAIANSVNFLIDEKTEFSKVRKLPEALSRISDCQWKILKEWLALSEKLPQSNLLWSTKVIPEIEFPWQFVNTSQQIDEKELKKRDLWLSMFMPQGAFLAARVDTNHWLTFGCGDFLPVLVGNNPVLMAFDDTDAPIRFGYIVPSPTTTNEQSNTQQKKDVAHKKEPQRIGWFTQIPDTEIYLRMSGLLWQEAAHRLVHSCWLTRESYGRGQIILFSSPPTFRGVERGTMRVFLNAVVLGPGLGTIQPVKP